MISLAFVGCFFFCDFGVAQVKGGDHKSLQALQGHWELVRVEQDGQTLDEKATVERKEVLLVAGGWLFMNTEGRPDARGSIVSIDNTKTPKHISLRLKSVRTGGGLTVRGIYDVQCNELRLCTAHPADPFPTGFGTKAGDGARLKVFRRIRNGN